MHNPFKHIGANIRVSLRSPDNDGLLRSMPENDPLDLVRSPQPVYHRKVNIFASEPSFYIYYSQLASTFTHIMFNAGYQVEVSTYNNSYEQFKAILEHWMLQKIAGLAINAPDRFEVASIIDRFRANGTIVVLIGRRIDYPETDYVGADNQGIGYQAAHHLIELGHTRIAYIGDFIGTTGHDRATGYIRAMQEAHLSPRLFTGPETRNLVLPAWFTTFTEAAEDPVILWRAIENREITAGVCFNDGLAVWVQDQLHKLNLSIPRDLSLVSVDNLPFFPFLDAPLTTFALPGEDVAKQAAELMLRRMEGEDFPPQHIFLPARFIQRLSSAPPRD